MLGRTDNVSRAAPGRSRALARFAILAILAAAPSVDATVVNTKHNLTAARPDLLTDSTEVCAYCHTPIGNSATLPRWDRAADQTSSVYSTYDSFGRSNLSAADAVGSVSFVCLSCHDGTQALDVAGNMPGNRGPAQSGAEASTTLSEAHPVGIRYGSDVVRSDSGEYVEAPNQFGISDDPSDPRTGFHGANSAVIDDVTVWWVETGEPGRQRSDVHLYSRRDLDGSENAYVECASCHDPHTENPMFLRVADRDATVCQACHEK